MNIFDIEKNILSTMQEIEDNEGEITPEIEEKLQINNDEFKHKVECYVQLIRELEGDISIINEETKRLANRKKVKENTIKRLKKIIIYAIEQFGDETKTGTKFIDYCTGRISVRKSSSVEVNDDALDATGDAFKLIIDTLEKYNQLDTISKVDINDILQEINKELDEPITEEDFSNIIGAFTFDLNLKDCLSTNYNWFKELIRNTGVFKLVPKVNKTDMKIKLAEGTSNIAKIVENKSIIMK